VGVFQTLRSGGISIKFAQDIHHMTEHR